MTPNDPLSLQLPSIHTLDQLRTWTDGLKVSGTLDEHDPTRCMAARRFPRPIEILDNNGQDLFIRLPSGELAQWDHEQQAWVDRTQEEESA